ncbi:hypothetical protein PHLCEN_2v5062 [Hermanssonia centrifuga]|uniref:U3-containing 90S pre-ribosomal complex subunit-domain containing protein n=1 Tax=Hermanssonia centrifuga TaxID=98765 RepID=A0A2R6PCX5_9APHY|nr:hypothetical protein PHLCEN_2v5062 [Hermanssonia centrifuga]
MIVQRGDDLDDDFVPDDLVALSDDDDAGHSADGDDVNALLSAEEDVPENPEVLRVQAAATEKKRKRRVKEKERKAKKIKLAESTGVVEASSVAAQSPSQLLGYLSTKQAKTFSKMSGIELADIQIPESSIADTTMWSGSRNLDQLPDFITEAGAALRVADVTRTLRSQVLRGEKGGEVAKLFAKHFKLEEHVAFLRKTKLSAAVGTPGRLGKLLENDALATTALTHIIIDVSHQDTKKRNVLDIPETRDEVFKTVIGVPKVLEGIRQGKIQVVLL